MKSLLFFLLAAFPLSYFAQQKNSSAFKFVETTKIPKPIAPAKLVISNVKFNDSQRNNNQALDASEKGTITFTLKNEGKGEAYESEIIIDNKTNAKGIRIGTSKKIPLLKPSETSIIEIPISANSNIENNEIELILKALEGNGFDSDPVSLKFNAFKFRNPQLVVADYKFSNKEGEGKIKLGETVSLQFMIQNKGQGIAKNIKISISNPINVFPVNDTFFEIVQLEPNKTANFSYDFFANTRYKNSEISLGISVSESYKNYGDYKNAHVSLDQVLTKTQSVTISSQDAKTIEIEDFSLTAEVDKNIPVATAKNPNRIALIIGNEDYSSKQEGIGTEVNVAFAENDAYVMKEYLTQTFGVEEQNMHHLVNATGSEMKKKINLVCEIMKRMEGNAELYFYFAGHGYPDEVTKIPYLIPVDVSATNLSEGINLYDMYRKFADANPKKATVFLDACFSGGGRDAGLLAARALKIKPKQEPIVGNIVVLSATSDKQSALPYKAKQHGIFTYFLLKKLQESQGEIDYSTLFNAVAKNVSIESLRINEKAQDPQILFGDQLLNEWGSWKVIE
jgi:hypothetical protein